MCTNVSAHNEIQSKLIYHKIHPKRREQLTNEMPVHRTYCKFQNIRLAICVPPRMEPVHIQQTDPQPGGAQTSKVGKRSKRCVGRETRGPQRIPDLTGAPGRNAAKRILKDMKMFR